MRSERVRVGAIVAVASAACLAMLPGLTRGFWRDEAATATVAIRSWADLFRLLPNAEGGFAGYEVFIHLWAHFFGTGEGWLRLPSLMGVFVAIVASGLLADRIGGRWAGIATAVLLALHPILVPFYGLEARGYALGAGFTAVAALAAHRAGAGEKRMVTPTFAVAATLAIGSHFLIVLAIAVIAVWLVPALQADRRRSLWLALPGVTAVGMYVLTSRATVLQSWIAKPGPRDLANVVADTVTPAMFVLVGALVLAVWALRRNGGGSVALGVDGGLLGRAGRLDLAVLVGWLVLPAVILLAYSIASKPSLLPRYVITSVLPGAILVGLAVDAVVEAWRERQGTTADASVVMAAGLVGLLAVSFLQGALRPAAKAEDLGAAARYVLANDEKGDGILYAPTWAEAGMRWYIEEDPVAPGPRPDDLSSDPATSAREAGRLFSPPLASDEIRTALAGTERVWIIGYPNRSRWEPVVERGMPLAEEIRSCWTKVQERRGGISIQLWERPADLPAGELCPA